VLGQRIAASGDGMSLVRSTQLGANAAVSTSETALYTVPTGKRTILKSVTINNGAASTNKTTILFRRSGTPFAYLKYYPSAANAAGDTIISSPWIVLNAGDAISAEAASASVGIVLSGAELTL
jgi:hypothetical protein